MMPIKAAKMMTVSAHSSGLPNSPNCSRHESDFSSFLMM